MQTFGFDRIETVGEAAPTGVEYGNLKCVVKGRRGEDVSIANEFICNRLALAIGLPVAPGVVVELDEEDEYAWVTMRFTEHGEQPPPVLPDKLCQEEPKVSAGVIAFDCWIGNRDRHSRNLAYSKDYIEPIVFDHDEALFSSEEALGERKLEDDQDTAVISKCLQDEFRAPEELRGWCDRIERVHENVVSDYFNEVQSEGLLGEELAVKGAKFLNTRKSRVRKLLSEAKDRFPKCDPNDWALS